MTDPQTAIYGASDDLIEIEGEINDELYANYGKPTYVRVGKWTFEIEYDVEGIWRVDVVNQPDGLGCRHFKPGVLGDFRDYTEVVKFNVEGTTVETVESPKEKNHFQALSQYAQELREVDDVAIYRVIGDDDVPEVAKADLYGLVDDLDELADRVDRAAESVREQ